jgi:hypothetical protein
MAAAMSLKETREHIKHHGEMMREAGKRAVIDGNMEYAARCADRMECALGGKLLIGDPESREPNYMMGHQSLIHSAQHHGLVKNDLDEANEDGEYD